MATQDELKQEAAIRAVEFVKSGMVVGLGSGSTAGFAVQRLAARIKAGELENIVGIPSSANTGRLAKKLGIPLTGFDEQPHPLPLRPIGASDRSRRLALRCCIAALAISASRPASSASKS